MRGWRVGLLVSALMMSVAVASAAGSSPGTGSQVLSAGASPVSPARLDPGPLSLPVRPHGLEVILPARSGLVTMPSSGASADLTSIGVGFGLLWVIDQPYRCFGDVCPDLRARLLTVDLRTHRLVGAPIRVGRGASQPAAGAGSIWLANSDDATVSRIDPRSRRVVATIHLGGRNLSWVAVTHGMVWVLRQDYDRSKHGGELIRIDPTTDRVFGTTILGKNVCGEFMMAVSRDAIWVTGDAQGRVIRIDPSSGRIVARISLGIAPIDPVVAGGALWVRHETNPTPHMWRLDLSTNAVSRVRLPGGSLDWMRLASAGGSRFWATDGTTATLWDASMGWRQVLAFSLPQTGNLTMVGHTLWGLSWDDNGSYVRWVNLAGRLVVSNSSVRPVA